MKIFLRKILIFSSIIIGYFGLNIIINKTIFNNTKIPVKEVNILIAGDSHTERSLNPKLFCSAQNISQPAEPYVITYWKLKYILKRVRVDTLMLGFSHVNISAFNDLKFSNKRWSATMFQRTYPINGFKGVNNLEVDYLKFYKTYFHNMCLFPKTNHIGFIGGYSSSEKNDLSYIEANIKRHYYYNEKELGVSEVAIAYLDSILRICAERDIAPVLVGSPVHEEYYKRIPLAIKNRFDNEKAWLMKNNITVIDLSHRFYEDGYYYDADHLNGKGAAKFTIEIINLLY